MSKVLNDFLIRHYGCSMNKRRSLKRSSQVLVICIDVTDPVLAEESARKFFATFSGQDKGIKGLKTYHFSGSFELVNIPNKGHIAIFQIYASNRDEQPFNKTQFDQAVTVLHKFKPIYFVTKSIYLQSDINEDREYQPHDFHSRVFGIRKSIIATSGIARHETRIGRPAKVRNRSSRNKKRSRNHLKHKGKS